MKEIRVEEEQPVVTEKGDVVLRFLIFACSSQSTWPRSDLLCCDWLMDILRYLGMLSIEPPISMINR